MKDDIGIIMGFPVLSEVYDAILKSDLGHCGFIVILPPTEPLVKTLQRAV